MAGRDIIVIGTSAGGVEALWHLARGLPSGLPASLFVVCHLPAGARSVLPEILSRSGALLATHAVDGEPFYPGQIYVAPPDRHLLLEPGARMRLTRGARENHHRPAIDPLFRTAARHYGPRVIAAVLTGALYDGTAGLLAVRSAGGLAVVQDPGEALIAAMPANAARIAGHDHMVRIEELAPLLVRLVQEEETVISDQGAPIMDPLGHMHGIVDHGMTRQAINGRRGQVSVFTCPECGGALWQVGEMGLVRFRCRGGHAYQAELLLAEQTEALEAALWTAVRIFQVKSVLASQRAHSERSGGDAETAARFEEQAPPDRAVRQLIAFPLPDGVPLGDAAARAPR